MKNNSLNFILFEVQMEIVKTTLSGIGEDLGV